MRRMRLQVSISALFFLGVTLLISTSVSASPLDTTSLPAHHQSGANLDNAGPNQQTPPTPILLTDSVEDPHQPEALYFAPTGHTLRGSFLQYWQQHGGLSQFGYPITEEFTEPLGPNSAPIMVQYFQRNRFEHHPENQPPNEVLLGTLGQQFLPADAPSAKATSLPAPAVYFPETGHNLSGEFKAYWETHGGLAIHGYPVTEPFEERSELDGREYKVQYFERSRMELHPENRGTEYEVLLGQLGRQLAGAKGYFSGAYPRYGHAADFSWVSGVVVIRLSGAHPLPNAGCFVIQYDENDKEAKLQLVGYPFGYEYNSTFTVFGRLLRHDEDYRRCDSYPNADGYGYKKIQLNPTP